MLSTQPPSIHTACEYSSKSLRRVPRWPSKCTSSSKPPGNGHAQPPFKRPCYDNNGGAGYGSSAQLPSNPNSHNHKMNQAPSGSMQMGASTNKNQGRFSGNRPPRSTGPPFGYNSPIQLNSSGPHYDPSQQNLAQPTGQTSCLITSRLKGRPIPLNGRRILRIRPICPFPANTTLLPTETTLTLPSADPLRMNHFPSDFSGGANFGAGPDSSNNPFRAPGSNHAGNPHRPTRGGFRGASVPGGPTSRDRMVEMGPPDAFGNNIFSFTKSDRQGPRSRGRNTNGHSTNRSEDHGSNYSGTRGGGSFYGDWSSELSNRGSRSISNLPTLAFHRGGIKGRGGGVGSSRGMGDRSSAAQLGRRTNGRDLKFEDRKPLHRMGRGGALGSNSGGDRGDRAKLNGGVRCAFRILIGIGSPRAPSRLLNLTPVLLRQTSKSHRISPTLPPPPNSPRSATKQDADVASGENGEIPPPTKADAPLATEEAKSVGTIEMGKKIYNDTASAVTGLDLAIDDANSDNEEQALERGVNDQLFPKSCQTTPKPHSTDSTPLTAEQPETTGSAPPSRSLYQSY
ncbi:hypothetical protein PCASD_06848 [Puccinia coronata f. sp. avenae]|uniref:Uncharacterized protein n=1 Tax=Puccinia coronata f. sp. avenae TaxID=200324 RepID=A0A2N5UQD4_9BASI|nr:hypothetical protein PCASD_06848 [Puccinia coronata f. sp. avenae]